jgi:hypothetical protein
MNEAILSLPVVYVPGNFEFLPGGAKECAGIITDAGGSYATIKLLGNGIDGIRADVPHKSIAKKDAQHWYYAEMPAAKIAAAAKPAKAKENTGGDENKGGAAAQ